MKANHSNFSFVLRILTPILSSFVLHSCLPPEPPSQEVRIDLTDPIQRQIMDLQDRQDKDSLYLLLHSSVPEYRYLAARAFASIRNEESVDSLAPLLKDPIPDIRAMSAYAIGQTGSSTALPYLKDAFNREDIHGADGQFNRAILEATGKCGGPEELALLSSINTYELQDTLLLEGLTLGIYRLALKSVTSAEGTKKMVVYASNPEVPSGARLIAAHYLARVPRLDLATYTSVLTEGLKQTANPDIAMALVSAFAKTKTAEAGQTLVELYQNTDDYRIKVNILSALGNFDYATSKELAAAALRDDHWAVRERAGSYFLNHGNTSDAPLYRQLARDSLAPMTRVAMYRAALRHLPDTSMTAKSYLSYEIRRSFDQSTDPYEKAALLMALSEFPWNYRSIPQLGFADQHPAVRVAAVQALQNISESEKFGTYFGAGFSIRRNILEYLLQAIQSEDPGMMAVAAQALCFPDRNYAQFFPDLTLLKQALEKLELPREIETWYELKRAIAFIGGEPLEEPLSKPGFSHPIDWTNTIFDIENPELTLFTNKGKIVLHLFPELAPGSVANIIQLAIQGFYDNKVFHRTVPNFVVQGGCPRGDGYGSLDYAIRSELPPIYYHQEGMLGMASAGNHTEGTQFFITHSPTPHLDGNYTIFGKVKEGMPVVHRISAGDVLQKVEIDSRFNQ